MRLLESLLAGFLASLLASCPSLGAAPEGSQLSLEVVSQRLVAFERTADTFLAYYSGPGPGGQVPRDPSRVRTWELLKADIATAHAAVEKGIAEGADASEALRALLNSLPPRVAARDPEMLPLLAAVQLLVELWLPPEMVEAVEAG